MRGSVGGSAESLGGTRMWSFSVSTMAPASFLSAKAAALLIVSRVRPIQAHTHGVPIPPGPRGELPANPLEVFEPGVSNALLRFSALPAYGRLAIDVGVFGTSLHQC
jgi:hypothetical protein